MRLQSRGAQDNLLEEHAGNDTGYSVEQAVRQGAVIQEEIVRRDIIV